MYNNDNRTFIQAEKSDIKTHYCGFMADSSCEDALRRGCNCNPTCQGKCSHPVYFVQKIKGVYNCRVICKRESDLIRKSEKESTSVGLESQKDAIHLATDVATLPIG